MKIGRTCWVIAEGYSPPYGHGDGPEFESHETACILNAGEAEAHVRIITYYADRDPVGPYKFTVPGRRTLHTRLDSHQAETALLTTVAFPAD